MDYFKGWKDACYDVADFLDHLAENAPEEVKHFASSYSQIAQSVRIKGDTALAQAQAIVSSQQ